MSAHYHAFQNRGYLFTNHEVLCQQWRTAFSDYNPKRIASILDLDCDTEYLYVSYFGILYRLRLTDGVLEKQEKSSWNNELYFNESMSIYQLLSNTVDVPRRAGEWISDASLDVTATHRRDFPDPLLVPFARRYSGKQKLLDAACQQLGGTKINSGDVGYEFQVFPQIPLRLIFWDADEDFPAQAQILFDQFVTDYIHSETTGCIVSDLLEKLEGLLP